MTTKAWQVALEVLKAEEQARQPKPQPEKPKPTPKPKTEIYKWKDKTVKDRKVLADEKGSGKLVKCRIVSPTDSFHVLMVIDGETLIDDDYEDLTETLAAYQEDSTYYLHLEDKAFTESLLLVVSVTEATTFTLLYAEVLLEESV
jgi:hypothetical protein